MWYADLTQRDRRARKSAVGKFLRVLKSAAFAKELPSRALGYRTPPAMGEIIAE